MTNAFSNKPNLYVTVSANGHYATKIRTNGKPLGERKIVLVISSLFSADYYPNSNNPKLPESLEGLRKALGVSSEVTLSDHTFWVYVDEKAELKSVLDICEKSHRLNCADKMLSEKLFSDPDGRKNITKCVAAILNPKKEKPGKIIGKPSVAVTPKVAEPART